MKHFLLIILLLSINATAQPYHKLIGSNKYWDLATYNGGSVCNIDDGWAFRYFFSGDSLMPNGLTYAKLYYYKMRPVNQGLYCPPFYVDTSVFLSNWFMREDTVQRKVYIYAGQDELLYDFNLNQGDNLQSLYATGGSLQTIDSVKLELFSDGSIRKVFFLQNSHYYIEGIGSPSGGLAAFMPNFWTGGGTYMLCHSDNSINLVGQVCSSTILNVTNATNADLLSIHPNPANDITKVNLKGCHTLTISTITGERIMDTWFNNEMEINCTGFSSGIYIFQIKSATEVINRRIVIGSVR